MTDNLHGRHAVLCMQRSNPASRMAKNAGAARYAAVVCYHLTILAGLPA